MGVLSSQHSLTALSASHAVKQPPLHDIILMFVVALSLSLPSHHLITLHSNTTFFEASYGLSLEGGGS